MRDNTGCHPQRCPSRTRKLGLGDIFWQFLTSSRQMSTAGAPCSVPRLRPGGDQPREIEIPLIHSARATSERQTTAALFALHENPQTLRKQKALRFYRDSFRCPFKICPELDPQVLYKGMSSRYPAKWPAWAFGNRCGRYKRAFLARSAVGVSRSLLDTILHECPKLVFNSGIDQYQQIASLDRNIP